MQPTLIGQADIYLDPFDDERELGDERSQRSALASSAVNTRRPAPAGNPVRPRAEGA